MIIGPVMKFKDFLKPGLAISFVCFIVSMILLPVFIRSIKRKAIY